MSKGLKYLLLVFLFHGLLQNNSFCQSTDIPNLNLANSGRIIENTISLVMTDSQYDALRSTTGEKIDVNTELTIINGDSLNPEEISTRGQTTLMFKRKSLSFKLQSEALIRHGNKTDSLKKFSLLNLSMDQYYCRNRLAFEMMEKTGIFSLFYAFCDLRINGKSEGIFMILERPEDWALRKENSPLVMRRGYGNQINETKSTRKTERTEIKKYREYYSQIYKSIRKLNGEELYKVLSDYMDMDSYMKWLAFNFFVQNGDYADEVFFYIDPVIKKYRIIPWDYDDIFASAPHEGKAQRNKAIGDKLLFSSEDKLDEKIASDPYMYKIYLSQFKEVLEELSPDVLKQVFENSYAELYPFFSDNEIISNSESDVYKDASLDNLKSYLIAIYMREVGYRVHYMEYFKRNNNSPALE